MEKAFLLSNVFTPTIEQHFLTVIILRFLFPSFENLKIRGIILPSNYFFFFTCLKNIAIETGRKLGFNLSLSVYCKSTPQFIATLLVSKCLFGKFLKTEKKKWSEVSENNLTKWHMNLTDFFPLRKIRFNFLPFINWRWRKKIIKGAK